MTSFFGKKEILVFLATIVAIILISIGGFSVSFRRARDESRRADISNIATSMNKFKEEYGFFPLSSPDGKILACIDENSIISRRRKLFTRTVACEWGKDQFSLDPTDPSFPKLLDPVPPDPNYEKEYSYTYLSDGDNFQVFAHLEGKSEPEFDQKVEDLKVKCGIGICNAMKTSADAPLDKAIK